LGVIRGIPAKAAFVFFLFARSNPDVRQSLRQLQADTFRRSAQQVCIQVHVPRGGGRVSVAEQLSNYWQPKASTSTDARMRMT
jgi:hypothetical protein